MQSIALENTVNTATYNSLPASGISLLAKTTKLAL